MHLVRVPGHTITMQKPIVFLYTRAEQSEIKIRIPFIIESKYMKYLE